MSIKMRQRVERMVVRRVVKDALAAGYSLNVQNGGDGNELPTPSRKAKEVLDAMFATDEEKLILYKDQDGKPKRFGWVWFVYGNGGWDVIADNTTNVEDVLKGAGELADKYAV